MTTKPQAVALKQTPTNNLKSLGSHAAISVNMGVLDPRPSSEDTASSSTKDYTAETKSVFRNGPVKNPYASTYPVQSQELPEESEIYKAVAYGFILGVSFFLVTRYIRSRLNRL
jgi:hypothetical protein